MIDLSQESPLWREWAESRHSVQRMREELDGLRAENYRLIAAAPELVEALVIVHECGLPEKVSMYDEEGVEGWQWCHPDGRIWSEIGSWYEAPPMHPIARAALAKAGASPINIDTAIDNARGGK